MDTRKYFQLLPPFPKAAGTIKEFDDWDALNKSKYPVRFKIKELVDTVSYNLYSRPKHKLYEAKLWVLYRFTKKHKYNTIVVGKPGYYEPCDLILTAPFVVFAKFMDTIYAGNSHVLWESLGDDEYSKSRQSLWNDMETLYNWWTVERPDRERKLNDELPYPKLPDEWGLLSVLNSDYEDEPVIIEWKHQSKMRRFHQQAWVQQDIKMLQLLAKIHTAMWD